MVSLKYRVITYQRENINIIRNVVKTIVVHPLTVYDDGIAITWPNIETLLMYVTTVVNSLPHQAVIMTINITIMNPDSAATDVIPNLHRRQKLCVLCGPV